LKSYLLRDFLRLAAKIPNRADLLENTSTRLFRNDYSFSQEEIIDIENEIASSIIRNMKSLTGIIKSHNPDALILLSTFHELRKDPSSPQNSIIAPNIKRLNHEIKKLGDTGGFLFVDLSAQLLPRSYSILLDNHHFNPEGASMVSEIFANSIKSHISDLSTSN